MRDVRFGMSRITSQTQPVIYTNHLSTLLVLEASIFDYLGVFSFCQTSFCRHKQRQISNSLFEISAPLRRMGNSHAQANKPVVIAEQPGKLDEKQSGLSFMQSDIVEECLIFWCRFTFW